MPLYATLMGVGKSCSFSSPCAFLEANLGSLRGFLEANLGSPRIVSIFPSLTISQKEDIACPRLFPAHIS